MGLYYYSIILLSTLQYLQLHGEEIARYSAYHPTFLITETQRSRNLNECNLEKIRFEYRTRYQPTAREGRKTREREELRSHERRVYLSKRSDFRSRKNDKNRIRAFIGRERTQRNERLTTENKNEQRRDIRIQNSNKNERNRLVRNFLESKGDFPIKELSFRHAPRENLRNLSLKSRQENRNRRNERDAIIQNRNLRNRKRDSKIIKEIEERKEQKNEVDLSRFYQNSRNYEIKRRMRIRTNERRDVAKNRRRESSEYENRSIENKSKYITERESKPQIRQLERRTNEIQLKNDRKINLNYEREYRENARDKDVINKNFPQFFNVLMMTLVFYFFLNSSNKPSRQFDASKKLKNNFFGMIKDLLSH